MSYSSWEESKREDWMNKVLKRKFEAVENGWDTQVKDCILQWNKT